MGGALGTSAPLDGDFSAAVMAGLDQAIKKLNVMREEEGRGIEAELRKRLENLETVTREVSKLRAAVSRAYLETIGARTGELLEKAEEGLILREAAIPA